MLIIKQFILIFCKKDFQFSQLILKTIISTYTDPNYVLRFEEMKFLQFTSEQCANILQPFEWDVTATTQEPLSCSLWKRYSCNVHVPSSSQNTYVTLSGSAWHSCKVHSSLKSVSEATLTCLQVLFLEQYDVKIPLNLFQ